MISSGAISDLERHVAGDEDHRSIFAGASSEGEREARRKRRKKVGRITRVKVCRRDAPSVSAASSASRDTSAKTGSTVRTTNGRPMKVSATTIPAGW